jgi:Spy/CpxP family protein refolding chaperone
MQRTRVTIIAALAGIAVLGAAPSTAARRGDARPSAVQFRNAGDIGFREASYALNSLRLDRGQRSKIGELTEKYRRKLDDIRRDRGLSPSKRADKTWKTQTELRDRVLHVLSADQRARVESAIRRDRTDDRRDRRGNRPGHRF